jgi:L-ribulose-5-phosphate 4-epimerase
MLAELREEVYQLHMELLRHHLVVWTMGNLSARDSDTGFVVIKPSGVLYTALSPDKMVIVNLDEEIIEGDLKPSSDTATHLYIYRHRDDVGGIVHTHSTFATAFAAAGKSIPPYLTALCDEFGGPIPVGGLASIGGEEIGREVVRTIGDCRAVLMKNHGIFTIGKTPMDAIKAAVMLEDSAKTLYYAYQLGGALEIQQEFVERLHRRYVEDYGQSDS